MSKQLLSSEVKERICAALKLGASRRAAAQSAGISQFTFYGWLRTAAYDRSREVESVYTELLSAVEQVEGESELVAIKTIRKLGAGGIVEVPMLDRWRRPIVDPESGELMVERVYEKPDWKALGWLLERRFPETWGPKPSVAIEFSSEAKRSEDDFADDHKVITIFQEAVKLLEQVPPPNGQVANGAEQDSEQLNTTAEPFISSQSR